MADSGYRSPQFSEDVAWLPPWLQPHHPPLGDAARDEGTIFPQACEASPEENICNGQSGWLFSNGEAKFNSFHLHLSSEGDSQAANTPSSSNAMHFHLHLSSEGISQFCSDQLSEIQRSRNCKPEEGLHNISIPETRPIQNGRSFQQQMGNATPASDFSPEGCKPILSHKRTWEPPNTANQNTHQKIQGKDDTGNLKDADINDAAELSIAASEAMVISEMVSSSLESENLRVAAILEIALRVKQARNECYPDISDSFSDFSADVHDETDLPSDLDENSMADAFDDVGITVTQIVAPINSSCGKRSLRNASIPDDNCQLILQSNSSYDLNRHISETNFPHKGEKQSKKLKAPDIDIKGATSQKLGVLATESRPGKLPLEPPPLQQIRTCMYTAASCLRNQLKDQEQQLHASVCASITGFAIEANSKKDQRIQEDGKGIIAVDFSTSKNIKIFNGETSFISQSLEVMDESTSKQKEAHAEIVTSSGTPFKDLSRCLQNEDERNISKKYGVLAIESRYNNLPPGPPPLQQTRAYFRNQLKDQEQQLHENESACASIADFVVKAGSKEDRRIQEDGKGITAADLSIRKSIQSFNGETSFISESMDVMDESTSKLKPEAHIEFVASSGTPVKDLSRCPQKEGERNTDEGIDSSQHFVRSSSLSIFDPLCSIVPCSISSGDAPIVADTNQNDSKEEVEVFMNTKRYNLLQNLSGDITVPNAQDISLEPFGEGGECIVSRTGVEGPNVPSRKKINSLKPYSMVLPDLNGAAKVANYEQTPLHSMTLESMHYFPIGKNINCIMSNKDDTEVLLKPMDKHTHSDRSNGSRGLESKDHEEIDIPVIGAAREDIMLLDHHHKERCSPLILNNKKHRIRAYKVRISSGGEEESLEGLSKLKKYQSGNSINKELSGGQIGVTSDFPLQSSLHSRPAEKQSHEKKTVRFLDAKSNNHRTKSGRSLQPEYPGHGSHCRASKRLKDRSFTCKSVSGEQNYNYLKRSHTADEKRMLFQGFEFLLTGVSSRKEKELVALIRIYGGYVLSKIPSSFPDLRRQGVQFTSWKLPIVLSPRKVQSTKFLYGCATNAWILNIHWLVDSIQAGSLLPPGKYSILHIRGSERKCLRIGEPICFGDRTFIFDGVGIILYGKASFCTKFSEIIKHGGGQVFKSLQLLIQSLKNGKNTVGAIVVENEDNVLRHLKHCASEHNLQMMSASWIVSSLFSGKLLSFKKDRCNPLHRIRMPTFPQPQDNDMSQEI